MTSDEYTITATCQQGHSSILKVGKSMGKEWAESYAGLLDGTSPLLQHTPADSGSIIGKCAICGSRITCMVE